VATQEMIASYFQLAKKTRSPVIFSSLLHRQMSKADTKRIYKSLADAIQQTNTHVIDAPQFTNRESPPEQPVPCLEWEEAFQFEITKPLQELTPTKLPLPESLKNAPRFHALNYIHELPLSYTFQRKEMKSIVLAA